MLPPAHDPGREQHDHEERREEHTDPGDGGAGEARHQVADEDRRDDDRSRRDHPHRDRVQELALVEPAVVAHDTLLEERHDGEARAEGERAGLEEEDAEREEHVGIRGLHRVDDAPEPERDERARGERAPQPRRRRIQQDAHKARNDEEDGDLAARDEGDRRDRTEDRPEPAVVLHGDADELPRAAQDQRDHRWSDAVEERLDDGAPGERDVQRRHHAHDDERREDERHRRRDGAGKAAADVAEPHRELRGERAREGLRDREALEVLLLGDPAEALDEVALHVAGEGDRSAEAERPQAQEVPGDLRQRERRSAVCAQAMSLTLLSQYA